MTPKCYSKFQMDIVEKLRAEARRSKMTAYRLAKNTGVQISAVQKWFDGGGLNVSTAERIARVLGFKLVLEPIEKKRR